MDFKKLKSGSDVRGVAMGENAVLTPAVAQTLGRAFVAFLSQKLLKKPEQLTIAVGRDSRLSGPQLLGAVLEGITTTGATAATAVKALREMGASRVYVLAATFTPMK